LNNRLEGGKTLNKSIKRHYRVLKAFSASNATDSPEKPS
jgi:hypothetical protein